MTRAAAIVLLLTSGAMTACTPGGRQGVKVTSAGAVGADAHPRPAPDAHRTGSPLEPRWEDAFAVTPEFLAVVRPKSLREDRIYGGLFRKAVQLARERSRVVTAIRMVESMEDAEEVVIGLSEPAGRPAEMLLVERGVRADVDPAKLVDDGGGLLWAPGPSGPFRELIREHPDRGASAPTDDPDASLFELPGRTWVIASGPARDRARDAFTHPANRAEPVHDPQALAFVRVDGVSLVSHVKQLRGGRLSAVGHNLVSTFLSLPPGAEHTVRAVLDYSDDDAALGSEAILREVFAALGRTTEPALMWLGGAKVERTSHSVAVAAPLPPQLIDALLAADPL
jgi:hypothetical protein